MRDGFPNSLASLFGGQPGRPGSESASIGGEDTLAYGSRCILCEKKWSRSKRQVLHFLVQEIVGGRRSSRGRRTRLLVVLAPAWQVKEGDVLDKSRLAKKPDHSVL